MVPQSEAQKTLEEYDQNQKVFDEHTNEWDCCFAMGELEPDEVDAAEWEDDNNEPILPNAYLQPPLSPTHLDIATTLSQIDPISCPLPPPPLSDLSLVHEALPSSSSAILNPLASLTDYSAPLSVANHPPSSSSLTAKALENTFQFTEPGLPAVALWLFFGFTLLSPQQHFQIPHYADDGPEARNFTSGVGYLSIPPQYIETRVGQTVINFFWSISQQRNRDYVPP
ncbi:hypothetical protein CVT25_006275 [Psilocybe cyanescens]|uniref:Uncharacterized protein n=1 Tax=Psilocybe cyanescens TaxID=93625 RepID=A0A409X7C0_PSICY|nr:hypothetical protein CVT25_006275 [Psilocybe cyanescens]